MRLMTSIKGDSKMDSKKNSNNMVDNNNITNKDGNNNADFDVNENNNSSNSNSSNSNSSNSNSSNSKKWKTASCFKWIENKIEDAARSVLANPVEVKDSGTVWGIWPANPTPTVISAPYGSLANLTEPYYW